MSENVSIFMHMHLFVVKSNQRYPVILHLHWCVPVEKHALVKLLEHVCASDCIDVCAWISDDIIKISYDTLSTNVNLTPMQKSYRPACAIVLACMCHCIKRQTLREACIC